MVRGIGVSDDSNVLDIKNGLHAISVSDLLVVASNHGPVSTETVVPQADEKDFK